MEQKREEESISRETLHVFDLLWKYLLKEVSSPTVVHLINGLFGRTYSPDSPISFGKTESVMEQGEKLEKIQSDTILRIAQDDFVVEAQIDDDELIGLRIFEYGFEYAHATKRIREHGKIIDMDIPQGCVIFWESTHKTPDEIMVRLNSKGKQFVYEIEVFKLAEQSLESIEERKLVLLLPFCLLKFRKELKKQGITPERRKIIAEQEKKLLIESEGVLLRGRTQGIISAGDSLMLMEHIAQMHDELYKTYPEFQEAQMVLEERIKSKWKEHERQLTSQWKEHEQQLTSQWKEREQQLASQWQEHEQKAVQEAVKQAETKIIALCKQGFTVEQIRECLARESWNATDTQPTAHEDPNE